MFICTKLFEFHESFSSELFTYIIHKTYYNTYPSTYIVVLKLRRINIYMIQYYNGISNNIMS